MRITASKFGPGNLIDHSSKSTLRGSIVVSSPIHSNNFCDSPQSAPMARICRFEFQCAQELRRAAATSCHLNVHLAHANVFQNDVRHRLKTLSKATALARHFLCSAMRQRRRGGAGAGGEACELIEREIGRPTPCLKNSARSHEYLIRWALCLERFAVGGASLFRRSSAWFIPRSYSSSS